MRRVLETERGLTPQGRADATAVLGGMEFWLAEYTVGIPHTYEALTLYRELGDREGQAIQLLVLGLTAPMLEGFDAAMAYVAEARDLYDSIDDEWGVILADGSRNRLLLWARETEGLEQLFAEQVEGAKRNGTDVLIMFSHSNIGWMHLKNGDHRAAERDFKLAMEGCVLIGAKGDVAYCLEGLSEVAGFEGRWGDAARLLAAATAIREQTSYPRLGSEADRSAKVHAHLQSIMDTDQLDMHWRIGYEMTFDEMVQFAREQGADKEEEKVRNA